MVQSTCVRSSRLWLSQYYVSTFPSSSSLVYFTLSYIQRWTGNYYSVMHDQTGMMCPLRLRYIRTVIFYWYIHSTFKQTIVCSGQWSKITLSVHVTFFHTLTNFPLFKSSGTHLLLLILFDKILAKSN